MKFLITTGGTRVPIDDVRFIGNSSSGYYGQCLMQQVLRKGYNESILFRDFHNQYDFGEPFINLYGEPKQIVYKDYYDYLKIKDIIVQEKPNVIISAAAVSDYVVEKQNGKISSSEEEIIIKLKKSEKVLCSFRSLAPNAIIVGFKLLVSPTREERLNAIQKQLNCGVDFVVFNDLTQLRKGNLQRTLYDKHLNTTEIKYPAQLIDLLKLEYKNRINR